MEITEDEFPFLWQDIGAALVRIAGKVSHGMKTEWQKAIDNLLKDPLTPEDERNAEELERWYENDVEVKKSIGDLTISSLKLERSISEIAQSIEKLYQSMGCQLTGGKLFS